MRACVRARVGGGGGDGVWGVCGVVVNVKLLAQSMSHLFQALRLSEQKEQLRFVFFVD